MESDLIFTPSLKATPSVVIDILVEHVPVEPPPNVPMTPNLRPQLALPPCIILSPQERRIHAPRLLRLTRASVPERLPAKMRPQRPGLLLGQVPPHALEERHAEPRLPAAEDAVRRRPARAGRDDLEGLADVDDECARDGGDVDPVAARVEDLEAPYARWGGLEEEGPPAGGVLVRADALGARGGGGVVDELEAVLVREEGEEGGSGGEGEGLGDEEEEAGAEGGQLGDVGLDDGAEGWVGGRPLRVS